MLASFLITFRETLEAALIVGIVLGYLNRTGHLSYRTTVWWAVGSASAASGALAFALSRVAGGLTGRAEELFEGILMLVGAGLLTSMIFWMLQQRQRLRQDLEERMAAVPSQARSLGIFALVFVAILREGVETVLFLLAGSFASASPDVPGALLGIGAASILGVALYRGVRGLPIRTFFTATSILLLLFAAGLVSHGVHELEEAGVLPSLVSPVWDANHLVDENGTLGSFARGLFGYNGNPSLLELLSYLVYTSIVSALWIRSSRVPIAIANR